MTPSFLLALARPFEADDLAWKPVSSAKGQDRVRVVPYVTNRAIMDRLDRVCGPENWRNEYLPGPNGGLLCGLSIRLVREDGSSEWVTKWDGAENTNIEPVKGGLSASMRRAAVQWGVGRYLYRIPPVFAKVDERGRLSERPQPPEEFLPVPPEPKRLRPTRPIRLPAPAAA